MLRTLRARRPAASRRRRALATAALLMLATATLAGCATRPPADDPEAVAEFQQNNDPMEPLNRTMFDVHEAIDKTVLEPVARGYRAVVPQPLRTGVRNVLGNLRTPIILANDMLQGEPRRAGDTLGRFVINSTLGLGGIFDVANDWFGVRGHTEDFGQTFARWGVGEGPYIFIPILGPTNTRDLTGFGVGVAADPFFWFGQGIAVDALLYSRSGMTVVDTREGLIEPIDDLRRSSIDPYSTLRSVYRQRRQYEIENRGVGASAAAAGTGFGVGTGVDRER